ncbi:hypothetical protein ASZ78_014459 [Callipepla squamata]|uniref:Dihydrofolate reductase n=1 Tax=Callipepla squamata TaxID=9009 RepID=A0A226N4E1_CALSU|nr:hypothetical protein ASZ78_014459 [Callipepla squamata]
MARSLNSIVAVGQNMGIGKDGSLPWPPLRNEYKYFQRMTSTCHAEGKENAVIMGKKTWFSIPEKNRPLKDRINIVLSRELREAPKGAHYLSKSLDDALALLDSPELKSKVDMVWIVGGTSVYKTQGIILPPVKLSDFSQHKFTNFNSIRSQCDTMLDFAEGADVATDWTDEERRVCQPSKGLWVIAITKTLCGLRSIFGFA